MGIPNYAADFEQQYTFVQIGTITAAQTALAVTARDNHSVENLVDTKKVIWRPDAGTVAAILRLRSDGSGADDSNVIEVYAAKGADYYKRVCTLTTYQGDQDWSGGHFIDRIVMTNERWPQGIRIDSTTNEIGHVLFNTGGFDRFLFIVSTLDAQTTTIHVDIARMDKKVDFAAEIHSTLISVEAGTSNLESQLETIESELISIEADTDKLQSQLETQESQMVTTETQLEAIDSGVVVATTELTAQGLSLDSVVADGTQIQSQLETQEVQLTAIDSELVNVEADTTKITSQLETQEVQLTAIDSELVNIDTDVSDLVTEVVLQGLEQDKMVTDLSAIETEQLTHGLSLDSIVADGTGIQSQLETQEVQLTAIDSELVLIDTDTTKISSQLETQETILEAGTDFVSTGGGTEKLTIPATPFQVAGSAQACREVMVFCPSANAAAVYLQIGAVADVNDIALEEDTWLTIPISNTNLLNFFGAENDIVNLLWRN